MNGPKWSEAEIRHLRSLAGTATLPEIWRAFCRRHPGRTKDAIRAQLFKRGLPTSPLEDSGLVTLKDVQEILNCSKGRTWYWLNKTSARKIVRVRQVGRSKYTHRDDWRRMARQYPELFAGIEPDRLLALIEDERLAYDIAKQFHRLPLDRRIRCVQTRKIWLSTTAAAAELHVSPSQINWSIQEGKGIPCLNKLRFERYPPPPT